MSATSWVIAGTVKVGPKGHKHGYQLLLPVVVWVALFGVTLAALMLRMIHQVVLTHYAPSAPPTGELPPAAPDAGPLPPPPPPETLTYLTQFPEGDRSFVDANAMFDRLRGRTQLQATLEAERYKGNWLRVVGKAESITGSSEGGPMMIVGAPTGKALFRFPGEWRERLAHVNEGDAVTAVGQIATAMSGTIVLDWCEIEGA
jgi:hypothetical protein